MDPDNAVSISLWNHLFIDPYAVDEPKAVGWSATSVRNRIWDLRGGKSSVKNRNLWHPKDDPDAKPVDFLYGEWNHLKVVTREDGYDCYLNGVLVEQASLTRYPLLGAVATDDDRRVIVKLVNFSDEREPVDLTLDCDVEDLFEVELLAGSPDACNTMEHPRQIAVKTLTLQGASRSFCYEAPASSVSILRLQKR